MFARALFYVVSVIVGLVNKPRNTVERTFFCSSIMFVGAVLYVGDVMVGYVDRLCNTVSRTFFCRRLFSIALLWLG